MVVAALLSVAFAEEQTGGDTDAGEVRDSTFEEYGEDLLLIEEKGAFVMRKKMWTKVISLLCCTGMALTMVPAVSLVENSAAPTQVEAAEKEQVTVTYDANGGLYSNGKNTYSTTENKGEEAYIVLYRPSREGYILKGWTTQPGSSDIIPEPDGSTVSTYVFNQDTTLYAVWADAVTVTYDANGGSFYGDSETKQTSVIEKNTVADSQNHSVERYGYFFKGWSLKPNSDEIIPDNYIVNQDTTLYAVWEEAAVLTLDANGGAFTNYPYNGETSVDAYATIGEPFRDSYPWPTRDGYRCIGYSEDKNAQTVDAVQNRIYRENTTFYAVWVKEITVTYNANGGTFYDGSTVQTKQTDAGEEGNVDESVSRNGYALKGWALTPDATEVLPQKYAFDQDTTVYAIWTNSVNVTYDANGGRFNDNTTQKTNSIVKGTTGKCNEGAIYGYYYDPVRDGYAFKGWSLAADSTKVITDEMTFDQDTTFYAVWAKTVTVTYNSNGGTFSDSRTTVTRDVQQGTETYTDYGEPKRAGYKLKGWALTADATDVLPNQYTFNSNTTLYAIWTNTVTVTYNANGGKFNYDQTTFDHEVKPGEKVSIYDYRNDNTYRSLTREGYTCIGWSLKPDSNETLPDTYTFDKGTTLYAVWAEGVVVSFDANGGIYREDTDLRLINREFLKNEKVNLTTTHITPRRNGYVFSGWSLQKKTQTTLPYEYAFDQDTTVYAVWSEKVNVTFDTHGGKFENYDQTTMTRQAPKGKDPSATIYTDNIYVMDPVRDGYTFQGWSLTGNLADRVDSHTIYNKDTTLYAIWSPKSARSSGWVYNDQDGTWRYLDASGSAQTGWLNLNGIWYYMNGSGVMQTGWQNINGNWYYLNGSGAMVTGWLNLKGTWYYLGASGAMVTGWLDLNGTWYYLNGSGAMLTGWQYINGNWYYLNGSGAMVTGWQYINGNWYYMNGSGAMLTNQYAGGYWLSADGVWRDPYQAAWYHNARGWWYQDASGWYPTNSVYTIDGVQYRFNAAGYWV